MNLKYSILINSTDSFEDCWFPFFTLFKKYWPGYTGNIYLNTETKTYTHEGLNIISIQNNIFTPKNKITWSECLVRALIVIDDEIVLYMQEDYFLKDFVKNDIVEKFVQLMHDNYKIDCIHLTDAASPGEIISEFEYLYITPKIHQDRISCQAALWKKGTLLLYPRKYETAWNFEWWGSKRAAILNHNFYVVDRNWVKSDSFEIIPYIFTAVVGGRWLKEVVHLCELHNIKIDYSKRGFFERKTLSLNMRIRAKWKRLPTEIRSYFGLIQLKLKS
jgi:hypothetical protein